MTKGNIKFAEVKEMPFDEKIEWLENFLNQDNTSDEYDGFLVQFLFTEEEQEQLKKMRNRSDNLTSLLGENL